MKRTLDDVDLQIAVNAADSKLSSCKQSSSPSTIPGGESFGHCGFALEKNVENIFLGLPEVGDVGVRGKVFFSSDAWNTDGFSEQRMPITSTKAYREASRTKRSRLSVYCPLLSSRKCFVGFRWVCIDDYSFPAPSHLHISSWATFERSLMYFYACTPV